MNAHALASAAYGNPRTAYKAPRAAEYEVIARITGRLRKAVEAEYAPFSKVAEALHENRRLWVELAIDLANPDNALPQQLRVQLLGLAQFTITHTAAVLEGRASAEVLVDINTAVLRGLSGKADVT